MEAAGARTGTAGDYDDRRDRDEGRSLAQWFCLIVGPTLILVGLLGFLVEAKFDTATGGDPGQIDGENLIIFEVNGWHNLVHIASGLLLLVGAIKHGLAKTVAIVFGVTYVIVTVVGLIDGQDLVDLVPINPADNVLHALLAALALAVGLISTKDTDDRDGAAAGASAGGRSVGARAEDSDVPPRERGRDSGAVEGRKQGLR